MPRVVDRDKLLRMVCRLGRVGYAALMRGKLLLFVRRMHLYLGVFFAPLLLLFVITGWWQTVTINRNKAIGANTFFMNKLSDIHVAQYYPVAGSHHFSTWMFETLVVAMCIGLILSLVLGIALAFTMVRNRIPVFIALFLGIAVPVLLLALAHAQ